MMASIETEEVGEMHCRVSKMMLDELEKKLREFKFVDDEDADTL